VQRGNAAGAISERSWVGAGGRRLHRGGEGVAVRRRRYRHLARGHRHPRQRHSVRKPGARRRDTHRFVYCDSFRSVLMTNSRSCAGTSSYELVNDEAGRERPGCDCSRSLAALIASIQNRSSAAYAPFGTTRTLLRRELRQWNRSPSPFAGTNRPLRSSSHTPEC
jgi:hypothetical protein